MTPTAVAGPSKRCPDRHDQRAHGSQSPAIWSSVQAQIADGASAAAVELRSAKAGCAQEVGLSLRPGIISPIRRSALRGPAARRWRTTTAPPRNTQPGCRTPRAVEPALAGGFTSAREEATIGWAQKWNDGRGLARAEQGERRWQRSPCARSANRSGPRT
jgi:hypothetical protein